MRATFFGFESVRKALMASQKGIEVTSHNVSNVNTDGFARQRVDISSISPEQGATRFAKTKGDAVGGGVDVIGISQIRDQFLDMRYRNEAAEFGKWNASYAVMTDIENIFDEIPTNGLNERLNDLYTKLESFSLNAESIEFASIFRSSAQKVTEILGQYAASLEDLKEQYTYNIQTEINEVNSAVEKIAILNEQIKSELLQGSSANELNDARNLLLDKLSGYIGAEYDFQTDGQVSIKLGERLLLDAAKANRKEKLYADLNSAKVGAVFADGDGARISTGSLGGNLDGVVNEIAYYQNNIDALAQKLAEVFNGINDPTGERKLFTAGDGATIIDAKNIKISDEWMEDAQFITRTTGGEGAGRNDNLLKMIEALETKREMTPNFKGTFEEFAVSLISDVAVQTSYAKDMRDTSGYILNVIGDQRESIMGVSIDEETINMEKYQKSYNAAARIMTILDEMLDILINRTGIVGR